MYSMTEQELNEAAYYQALEARGYLFARKNMGQYDGEVPDLAEMVAQKKQEIQERLAAQETEEEAQEETELTWDQVETFDKEDPEHLNALATVVIQAGRAAYEVDLAVGEALMPKHGRCDWNASEDALPLWERGKGYAASFLAREAKKFSGCADMYETIKLWWAYGYDHARRGE